MKFKNLLLIILICMASNGCKIFNEALTDTLNEVSNTMSVLEPIPNGELDAKEVSSDMNLPIVRAQKSKINTAFIDTLKSENAELRKVNLQLFPDFKFHSNSISVKRKDDYQQVISGGNLESDYFLSLVSDSEGLNGFLNKGGYSYRLESLDNNKVIVTKVDLSKMPNEDIQKVSEQSEMPDTSATDKTENVVRSGSFPLSRSFQHNLLIVYSDKAKNKVSSINAQAASAVALADSTYQNSQVNIDLNIAGLMRVPYDESNDAGTDLGRLTETADGYMDDVHIMRDRVGADLVVLLVSDLGDLCGKSHLQFDSSQADDDVAFAVVDVDCIGKSSLTHELGHIAGAHHDWRNNFTPIPKYAHGLRKPQLFGSNKGWRSTMAYSCNDSNCPRNPPVFSNPDVQVPGSESPAGSPIFFDNARRLNETAHTLADFRINGPRISLYEGNNATEDNVCVNQAAQNENINFKSSQNERDCDNDEARSAILFDVPSGKVIKMFDSPEGNREDDWVEIIAKRDISELRISTFERSYENNDVQVIYHRNNGLDGKVSRLEIGSSTSGALVDLYEGNSTSQNLVCSVAAGQSQTYSFKSHPECDNDEARSAVLHNLHAGQVLRFYDSPDGHREDDWVEIIAKQSISELSVSTFEQSFENEEVQVIYHRNNGLDGKVSRLEIGSSQSGPTVDFYEGNSARQNLVCSVPAGQSQTYSFKNHPECDNDEARSAMLYNIHAGQVLRLYDSPDGHRDDDWIEIVVKRSAPEIKISSFEKSYNNANVQVIYHRNNGLDGKVSRFGVASSQSGPMVDLYESENGTQNIVCSLSVGQPREFRFTNIQKCTNDESRSLILYNVEAGTNIILYDSPSQNLEDDWIAIRVKQDMAKLPINTLEHSFHNNKVDVVFSKNNGLNGKVSNLEVTSGNSMNGIISFREGNRGTQNKVCDLRIRDRRVGFKDYGACDNDEARSVTFFQAPAGTELRLYDDPGCGTGDDYTTINLKQDVFRLTIDTFEHSYENSKVQVMYQNDNGLDGKVSCVRIRK